MERGGGEGKERRGGRKGKKNKNTPRQSLRTPLPYVPLAPPAQHDTSRYWTS